MTDLATELEGGSDAALDTQDVPTEIPVPDPGNVVFRMPRTTPYSEGFEFIEGNLDFGPAAKHAPNHDEVNLSFHAEGDGDGYCIAKADHPLIPDLMRRYPQVEIVESNTEPEAFVCEVCEKEYKTKRGLLNHKLSHK